MGNIFSCLKFLKNEIKDEEEDEKYNNEDLYYSYSIDNIIETKDGYGGIFISVRPTDPTHIDKLKELGVKAVLDVTSCPDNDIVDCEELYNESGITRTNIRMIDASSFDIKPHFIDCFEYIESNRKKGNPVLVHCMAGVSRSATVVIGYLMNNHGYDVEEAYEFVKSRRERVKPNIGFMKELIKLNDELYDKKSDFFAKYILHHVYNIDYVPYEKFNQALEANPDDNYADVLRVLLEEYSPEKKKERENSNNNNNNNNNNNEEEVDIVEEQESKEKEEDD